MKFHYIAIALVLFWGCNQFSQQQESAYIPAANLKTTLPGTWETVSFRVDINATDSLEPRSVFEVEEGKWVEKLSVQPVVTHFDTASKFRQEHKNQADSLVRLTRGIWNIFGDTLMMIAPDATYQYRVEIQGQQATFRCLLDWDGDGQEDDEYIGIQKLVKKQ